MARDETFLAALRIEPAPTGHCAVGFDCGEKDLTEYICDGTSAADEIAGVSRSYLVYHDDGSLVGYFTVAADSIRLKYREERPKNIKYATAPAIKLGRMGVAVRFQRKGVASWILDVVTGLAQEMAARVGVRYVTLDSLPVSKPLYVKYGFKPNKEVAKWELIIRNLKDLPHTSMRYDIHSGPTPQP